MWQQILAAFRRRTSRQIIGARGEDLAAAELERRGYKIIERNYRARGGEIDLIATEQNEVVFVEVKTRTDKQFGNPEEAVNARKIKCLSRAAAAYCAEHRLMHVTRRCDVVAIMLTGAAPEIIVFKDAVILT